VAGAPAVDADPQLGAWAAYFKQALRDKLIEHKHHVCKHGDDTPEIRDWRWGRREKAGSSSVSDTGGDNV
jgi:xylulose-5-phosphate/fructose-6-phosphate phosphoketolase